MDWNLLVCRFADVLYNEAGEGHAEDGCNVCEGAVRLHLVEAALMGEQPNPWNLLQPQDATSRHRGAKPFRRYELLGMISLLSPEYLLSFERWPFHTEPPDHYALVSYLVDLLVSQSSALIPLHSTDGYQSS